MWNIVFLSLFLGTLIALIVVLAAFTRKIAEVEKERSDLEVEETRVFDFLHGLGEAFAEGVRPADLHRLIVEGAVRILEAHGGALYLVDKSDTTLVPAFVSTGYPPVLNLPDSVLKQQNPAAIESFVKLHSIRRGEGVLGRVWDSGQIQVLGAEDLQFDDGRDSVLHPASAMIGPLQYRRKTLGVLAVANGPFSTAFQRDEIALFRTIAEQSAFALYNEAVYLEAAEKKRMDRDLQMAREIQSILLPSKQPVFDGFDIDGINLPANQVSGDYFDFIPIGPEALGIVIADVSGKGLPASLIMAMCRTVIRSQAEEARSPAEILRRVNRLLYPDIKEDMFVSVAFCILHKGSPDILLARAGHDPPLCYRAGTGTVETISPKGMALGIDSGDVFDRVCEDVTVTLGPGDTMVFYTDGTTEALDEKGAEFGLPGLHRNLIAHSPQGSAAVVRETSASVATFIGKQHQYDDITLIAIRKT